MSYETKYLNFQEGEHKSEPYTKYNPNGRIPAIIDHKNNDFVLWYASPIPDFLSFSLSSAML